MIFLFLGSDGAEEGRKSKRKIEEKDLGGDGETQAHGCAAGTGGVEGDVAVVREEDSLGDGETEAGAVGATGEKAVEDVIGDLGGDSRAGVDDVDHGVARAVVFLREGADGDGSALGHGVGGVEKKVEENLLELSLVDIDVNGLFRRVEAEADFALGELEADEDEGVADDVGEGPARVERGRGLGELEHARDDGFELVKFLADDADIGAAGVVLGEIEAEVAVKEFDDGERIADFVGDLGREQAEGGELLVLAEGVLALKNAGVEPRILEGDGGERRERGEEAFLVVVVAVGVVGEDAEDADGLVFPEHGNGEEGPERGMAGEIDDVDVFGRLDVEKLQMAAGREAGADQAGFQRKVALGQAGPGFAGKGHGAEAAAGGHVFEKQRRSGGEEAEGVARDGVVQLLAFELGDEGEAGGNEVFELPGLSVEMLELPEAEEDVGAFASDGDQIGEVGGGEASDDIAVEVDDAEDLVVVRNERGGHLGTDLGTDGDVARIGADIGHELRPAMKGDPAGDALAGAEGDLTDVGGHALVDLDFQFPGVGVEEGDGAGRGPEVGDGETEDVDHRGARALRSGGQAADGMEQGGIGGGRSGGRLVGVGGGHGGWPQKGAEDAKTEACDFEFRSFALRHRGHGARTQMARRAENGHAFDQCSYYEHWSAAEGSTEKGKRVFDITRFADFPTSALSLCVLCGEKPQGSKTKAGLKALRGFGFCEHGFAVFSARE